jgi:hypothetical protein
MFFDFAIKFAQSLIKISSVSKFFAEMSKKRQRYAVVNLENTAAK